MSATKTTVIAALVLVLTFGAGFIGGAAAHHLLTHSRMGGPPPVAHALVRHLDHRLDLTDAQRRQVEAIVQRHHARMRGNLEAANAEIERVLTPAQREKFAKMHLRLGRPHGRHGRLGDRD